MTTNFKFPKESILSTHETKYDCIGFVRILSVIERHQQRQDLMVEQLISHFWHLPQRLLTFKIDI
jgi:hypothetical protein